MKKLAGIVAAVLVLATAVFLLVDRDRGQGPTSANDVPGAPIAAGEPVREGGGAAAGAPESKKQITATPFSEPESAPAAAPDEDLLRVLVVDGASGFPVAGALVAASDARTERDPRRSSVYGPFLADFDDAPQRAVADERGIATIRTHARLRVAAKLGESYGYREFFRAPRGEIRLTVRAGWQIAVKVVTAWGAPAPGIPVVIRHSHKRPSPGSSQAWMTTRKPDGLAIMSHVSEPDKPELRRDDTVAAWIEGMDAFPVQAPLEDLRRGPLLITMPPVGQLRVDLLDPDGRPFVGDARVHVGLSSGEPIERRPSVIPSPAVRVDAANGSAVVPFAPVGFPLTVVASSDEHELAVQDVEALESSSTVRTVVLRFPARRSVLAGRLVDERLAPIGNREVRVELVTMNARGQAVTSPRKVVTDRSGDFAIPSIERFSVGEGGMDVDFELVDESEVVTHSGSVNVQPSSGTGETRLGDVRLVPPEVVAAGIVVDDEGRPVAGAVVTASSAGMGARLDFPPGERPRLRPPGQIPIRGRSGPGGAFVLTLPASTRRSPQTITAVNLHAELEGHLQRPRQGPFESGRRDVTLVLDRVGGIEGRLLLPPDLPVRKVFLGLGARGTELARGYDDCVDSDGRFRIAGIRPGRVTLEVKRSNVPEPLATIPDVLVPPDGFASDSRLQAIDLRGGESRPR